MEKWQDQGIVLVARRHGENGAVASLLTENNGRYMGYVRGAQGSKMRGTLEPGNLVDVTWGARVADSLGSFTLELSSSPASYVMQSPIKLAALQSACALCDSALPEREGHPGLFHGLNALFETLQSNVWGAAYVMWEIALLRELGFSLDFTACAGGGDAQALAYVSPKTGRAVSREAAAPYKDRLLPLPAFMRPGATHASQEDVLTGLMLTGYFLEHWVYAQHTKGVPEARLRFQDRMKRQVDSGHIQTKEEQKEHVTG